jgi:MFS family permease
MFYGWIVTGAALAVTTTAFGALYSFGVFFKGWLEEWPVSRAFLSTIFSLTFLTYGLGSVLMGYLSDRLGVRRTLALGGTIMGLGCLLSARTTTAGWLYLTWGLMVGLGVGTSYSPSAATVSRWFVRRKGLAVGLVVSGLGLGTLIFSPLSEALKAAWGWRGAAVCLGFIIWAVFWGAAWLMRGHPREMGLAPLGAEPLAGAGGAADPRPSPAAAPEEAYTLGRAMRDRVFWALFVVHGLWLMGMSIPMVHLVPHALDLGVAPARAAAMLAVVGGMSVLGRVALAVVGERLGSANGLRLFLSLQAVSLGFLALASGEAGLWAFAFFFGFTYGGLASMFPLATAEYFGLKAMGTLFGVILLGATLGGTIGPALAGALFEATRHYQTAFWLGGLANAGGVFLSLAMRRRGRD